MFAPISRTINHGMQDMKRRHKERLEKAAMVEAIRARMKKTRQKYPKHRKNAGWNLIRS